LQLKLIYIIELLLQLQLTEGTLMRPAGDRLQPRSDKADSCGNCLQFCVWVRCGDWQSSELSAALSHHCHLNKVIFYTCAIFTLYGIASRLFVDIAAIL